MTCKRQDLTRKQTISGIRLPFLLVKTVKHEQFYNDLKYYLQERELNAKNLLVNRAEKPDRREAAPRCRRAVLLPHAKVGGDIPAIHRSSTPYTELWLSSHFISRIMGTHRPLHFKTVPLLFALN